MMGNCTLPCSWQAFRKKKKKVIWWTVKCCFLTVKLHWMNGIRIMSISEVAIYRKYDPCSAIIHWQQGFFVLWQYMKVITSEGTVCCRAKGEESSLRTAQIIAESQEQIYHFILAWGRWTLTSQKAWHSGNFKGNSQNWQQNDAKCHIYKSNQRVFSWNEMYLKVINHDTFHKLKANHGEHLYFRCGGLHAGLSLCQWFNKDLLMWCVTSNYFSKIQIHL